MNTLKQQIREHAVYLGNGIIKIDSLINHQLLPGLMKEIGLTFAERFKEAGIVDATRIITAEVSGIAPALAVAQAMDIPMVFARKKTPVFMTEPLFSAKARSRTKAGGIQLHISSKFLKADDRIIIVDDFLATASTLNALAAIVRQSGASLLGIGCIIEKVFEQGRARLTQLGTPIISLARIDLCQDDTGFSIL